LHVLEIILAVAHYQSSLLDQDLLLNRHERLDPHTLITVSQRQALFSQVFFGYTDKHDEN